jgi:hypothetical protein
MKLRRRLAFLKWAADTVEKYARQHGMADFVAHNTRSLARKLRAERPAKRRARKWTTK